MSGSLITVSEAAEMLSVSRRTIRNWIDQGKLKAYRIGDTTVRVDAESLLKLVKPMEVKQR